MIFENSEIDVQSLPPIEETSFIKLDKDYLKVSYAGTTIFFLILFIGISVAYFVTDIDTKPLLLGAIVALWAIWFILSIILTKLGYNIRGYILRERDLLHRRGVIFKTITSIPFNRVQHCEVSQGPIQRFFGLNTLQVFTAGGSNSDLSIPGLKGEQAQKIKEFILKKTNPNKKEEAVEALTESIQEEEMAVATILEEATIIEEKPIEAEKNLSVDEKPLDKGEGLSE